MTEVSFSFLRRRSKTQKLFSFRDRVQIDTSVWAVARPMSFRDDDTCRDSSWCENDNFQKKSSEYRRC